MQALNRSTRGKQVLLSGNIEHFNAFIAVKKFCFTCRTLNCNRKFMSLDILNSVFKRYFSLRAVQFLEGLTTSPQSY